VLLITEGDQEPVTPVGDVVANTGGLSPEQNGAIGLKLGLLLATIVIVTIVGIVAVHCPELGVKVYVTGPNRAVFTVGGDQLPDIAGVLLELRGNTGAVAFWQTVAGIPVNVGETRGKTVIFIVCVVAQGCKLAFGVKT
tara:strand:+ start:40 stop:456 length:417 start_codon:yes stop_codon:yes gene_type:complete